MKKSINISNVLVYRKKSPAHLYKNIRNNTETNSSAVHFPYVFDVILPEDECEKQLHVIRRAIAEIINNDADGEWNNLPEVEKYVPQVVENVRERCSNLPPLHKHEKTGMMVRTVDVVKKNSHGDVIGHEYIEQLGHPWESESVRLHGSAYLLPLEVNRDSYNRFGFLVPENVRRDGVRTVPYLRCISARQPKMNQVFPEEKKFPCDVTVTLFSDKNGNQRQVIAKIDSISVYKR